jgi:hypothetical protein
MDPERCLIEAAGLLKTERWEAAIRLADYFDWRMKGGFEPFVANMKGDRYYRQLVINLG